MIRVLVESPFAGNLERNIAYARKACLDCLQRGEAPYASHLFFPQMLDDLKENERALGIQAGLAWGGAAAKTVVYQDFGITPGMQVGIETAIKLGRPVEYRRIL